MIDIDKSYTDIPILHHTLPKRYIENTNLAYFFNTFSTFTNKFTLFKTLVPDCNYSAPPV